MSVLSEEIQAFEAAKQRLETDHNGQWVVFFGGEQKGLYSSMEEAAKDAVSRFGRGPYLIRQIGASPTVLPASVMYQRVA